MRNLRHVGLALCTCILALGLVGFILGAAPDITQTHAGTEADPFTLFNSETLALSWTSPSYPVTLAEVEFSKGVAPFGDPLTLQGPPELSTDPDNVQRLRVYGFLKSFADGVYRFRLRLRNDQGTWSQWTTYAYTSKAWATPATPGGFSVSFK